MASTHEMAVKVIASIPGYAPYFKKAFGDTEVNIKRITEAMAEFERTLVTPNARFDKWLKGDKNAITQQELNGYKIFKESGCTICHNGAQLGGQSFQKMGVVRPYKTTNTAEAYFHDGAVWSLEESVSIMGDLQLGKRYTKQEINDITAFLKTLTGDQPKVEYPVLPPSGPNTPKFDPWAKVEKK